MISPTSDSSCSWPQIAGYAISEQIYLGSRTSVYRGIHTAEQRSVIIKMLRRDYPSFGELLQFRNQYTIARNLSIPGIIHPLSLESISNGYALVMEDWGGIALDKYIRQQPLALTEILTVALQIVDVLHDLHQHQVVHKDIKPANILIHPETHQIKLIDFSIASLLPKEMQVAQSPNILEGTLAYLAPEQTGRMNRGVDYRADFYSLGVTLYQLLTGTLPFVSDDPLELMHCHIAQLPTLVDQVNADVPPGVAAIVAKLMAKNAEDRYQSALGLKQDLQTCLTEWQATGNVADFKLGQRDLSDRFLIPEKLYGREAEVSSLLKAFEQVADGACELMLVAGFSGIGKTAVVNEIHKPIVRQRGYFIKGKFDQFNRNVPLSAFVQALRNFMGQLLSETDAQLAQWRTQILSVVGDNGQVLIDVIPELEQIIGQQPPAPQLSGSAAQNRFNRLFQTFIGVFTTAEHPLVLFLDDLQWADLASLQLIKLLMADSRYLLMVGAYRDNEVSPAHPFIMAVNDLEDLGATVNTITLNPLTLADINPLVADTLHCSTERVFPLSELINQKTQGNPFFITQFLTALHYDGYVTFDCDRGYWTCDLAQVKMLALTDDVVAFMAIQLQKLPYETQQLLALAACVGNQFDLETLAIISEQAATEAANALWKALQAGLILPTNQVYKFFQATELLAPDDAVNPTYRFLHDRVQQAAYSLIPDSQKQATHFKIGQRLQQNLSPQESSNRLFDIVNQLNFGVGLLENRAEQQQLAQLNLLAGQKAKAATAYATAVKYLSTGRELLGSDGWQDAYALTLAVCEVAAEAAYLATDFEQAEEFAEVVIQQAKTLQDQINIYVTQIHSNIAQVKLLEAIQIATVKLELIDPSLRLPENPTPSDFEQLLAETQANLANRPILDLLHLPEMADSNSLAAMRILASVAPSAYFAFPQLLPLIAMTMVNLSIKYGNTSASAFGYAMYGFILCGVVDDIESGYQFGQLAIGLVDKFDARDVKSKALLITGYFIKHWKDSLIDSLTWLPRAYQVGLESGDLGFAGYSAAFYCYSSIFSDKELEPLEQEVAAYDEAIAQIKQDHVLHQVQLSRQIILNLLARAENPCQLVGEAYDETEMAPLHQAANNRTTLAFLYVGKLSLSYLFQDIDSALASAEQAEDYLDGAVAMPCVVLFHFYAALAKLAQYPHVNANAQREILEQVVHHQSKLRHWADHAPMNYQHKFYLVEAERSRVLDQKADAIAYYDLAIAGAKAHRFIAEEALANERAARFYVDWGKVKIAQDYLSHAYYSYAHWGAIAKVQDLEERYLELLTPILQPQSLSLSTTETVFPAAALATHQTSGHPSHNSTSSSVSTAIDLETVLKASQTLSSKIQLDTLLATLLRTVLENAGADKGVLLMPHQNDWYVEAVATVAQPARVESILLTDSVDVPQSLINTVKRSLEPVLIANVAVHVALATDTYIMQQQPKSLLCTPILQRGRLVAILYLENRVAIEAFTPDRVELLNVLCAQAAISLENARLYSQSQEHQRWLTTLLSNLPGMVYSSTNDQTRTLQFVSEGGVRLTGYRPDELTDQHATSYTALIHADDREMVDATVQTALQTHQPFQMTYRIRTKQGQEKWVWEQGQGLYDQAGTFLSLEGFVTDISERKVAEAAVTQKSQELEQALAQLQNTQLQLVQNEKMASLGNLVAGVAHEINNPIGFLNGSIKNAQDYAQDLFAHLAVCQQHQAPIKAVQEHAEEIDLDFLSEDLPKLFESMQGAIGRIRGISTSLRTFSRADTKQKVSASLNEGLESTLLILKYRLKANEQRPAIQVTKDYGNLPEIDCFPGQLNQVFMNILANAIDVFDEATQDATFEDLKAHPQVITIQTEVVKNAIEIRIRDNGKGMPETVRAKIFDHLFTTKAVGKGTGLGMAIARQVVTEKHGGHLDVQSELGQGTEFYIRLPLAATDENDLSPGQNQGF